MESSDRCVAVSVIASMLCPTVLACPTQDGRVAGDSDPGISFRAEMEGAPDVIGQWDAPRPWAVIGIHAALFPTGEILHYSYPQAGPGSAALTWAPETDQFTQVTALTDVFCSGLSLLPNGELFVAGGNDYGCDFQGRRATHTFDPFSRTWEWEGDMDDGRWYPTNVTLGDGRVLILTGLARDCDTNGSMEIFRAGYGVELLPNEAFVPLFPSMHLLSSGRVALVAPLRETFVYDVDLHQWEFIDNSATNGRWNGTSVMIPGRTDEVMIIGGNAEIDGTATATCERIDLGETNPAWRATGSMNVARAHANVVILPDDSVLVVGGGDGPDLYQSPVLNAELYDPKTETWTLLPPQVFGRMYHSTAVLLPDGRVVSAGQDFGISALRQEVYNPAYLFKGPRPAIASAPDRLGYAEGFQIDTPNASDIEKVRLIALSSVTHSVNMHQRSVAVDFAATTPGTLVCSSPVNGNAAPPGYYMLFVVDGNGVPSEASMIRLEERGCVADWNSDGFANTVDFIAFLNDYVQVVFGSAWTYADPDFASPLGVLNTSDFVAYLNEFTSGCP